MLKWIDTQWCNGKNLNDYTHLVYVPSYATASRVEIGTPQDRAHADINFELKHVRFSACAQFSDADVNEAANCNIDNSFFFVS